jgi:hypothetical protein
MRLIVMVAGLTPHTSQNLRAISKPAAFPLRLAASC